MNKKKVNAFFSSASCSYEEEESKAIASARQNCRRKCVQTYRQIIKTNGYIQPMA